MTRQQKKEAGLVTATLVCSLLLFWAFAASIASLPHVILIILLLILTLAWVGLAAITFSLATSKISRSALVLVPAVFVVLVGQVHVGSLVAALLLVILLASAQRQLIQNIQSRIKYNTAQIFSPGARLILIGLVVVLAGLSIAPVNENLSSSSLKIPQKFVEIIIKPAERIITSMLPGYTSNSTIDQLIEAKLQSDTGTLSPGFSISPEEFASFHQDLTASYGLPISGQETLPALVTAYINQALLNLTKNSPLFTVLLALVTFLLVARLLVPILLWPTLGIIVILINLAQRAELLFLITLQEPVERLQL
ncbi:MAG: hypothetical protein ABIH36_03205 [bacterium]